MANENNMVGTLVEWDRGQRSGRVEAVSSDSDGVFWFLVLLHDTLPLGKKQLGKDLIRIQATHTQLYCPSVDPR